MESKTALNLLLKRFWHHFHNASQFLDTFIWNNGSLDSLIIEEIPEKYEGTGIKFINFPNVKFNNELENSCYIDTRNALLEYCKLIADIDEYIAMNDLVESNCNTVNIFIKKQAVSKMDHRLCIELGTGFLLKSICLLF